MIALSNQLIQGLREDSFSVFKEESKEHLKRIFKGLNQEHTRENIEAFLEASLKRGKEKFFLKKESHFLDYLECNARFGFDFESDVFYVPFSEFISQYEEKKNTTTGKEALYFMNIYEAEFPKVSNQVYIEIFEKLQNESLSLKELSGAVWVNILKKYLPNEEPHFLEKDLAVERLLKTNKRIEKYELVLIRSTIIYHLLSFKFGIGLDINPLYPKFGEILKKSYIDENKKISQFLEQGIGYLKEELGEEVKLHLEN